MHILVFLIAILLALTFAHPAMFLTDEWVTVNQLAQLHDGNQVITNEGKYGFFQNGTPSPYFVKKQNLLAYPLFLPVISLPAYWLLDLIGNNFIVFIFYLWTFLLITLALTLNTLFPEYIRIGKWRWTTWFIVGIFVLFFLNLYLLRVFTFFGEGAYPEIAAIATTHLILFAFLAVLIYEISRTLFENIEYALFSTLTCMSCSSYLFWTNFCKDHLLVAFLVTAIILMLVKLWYTENLVFLLGAFGLSGLLAWARPEVALGIAAALSGLVFYIWLCMKNSSSTRNRYLIILAPAFTFVGAIPFFINNYLFSHNIFIPTVVFWANNTSSSVTSIAGESIILQNTSNVSGGFLVYIQQKTMGFNLSTVFTDLYGIFFSPQSGSIGVFPIIPIFLVAILILPGFIISKKIQFTKKDYQMIGILMLVSLGVFIPYIVQIESMNINGGIVPDVRYLSPVYLPLTLIGLLIIKQIPEISERSLELIKGMLATWCIFIPLSLLVISRYSRLINNWVDLFPLLDVITSLGISLLAAIFIVIAMYGIIFNKSIIHTRVFLILLCAAPLIWQIDMSFLARQFGNGLGGYSFWIPVMLQGYAFIFVY